MTETTASNPQVTYKSLRKNMLHGNRDVTDKYWSILFFVILAMWIGSFGYAMHQAADSRPTAHNQTAFESRLNSSLTDNWFTEILSATAKSIDKYSKDSWSTIMFIRMFVSMLTMMCLMILIRFAPKFCAHLAIAGTTLTIISLISAIGMHLANDEWTRVKPFHEKLILYIVPELIAFVLCVSALVAMMYIKAFAMSEILRKSSRIFFFYRYSIFFGLFIFGVTMLVLNSTIKVVQDLGWNNILFYTIMGGSIYIMHFIYYFGRMVIAMLAATHHWTPNKNSIHFTALFSAIVSVCKHHFGTVCFNATVILPPIVALAALCKLKFEPVQTFANRFIKFVFSVYLTFYIAEYSTIVTAIHDLNFYQSTRKTFQVLIKDCPRSLAFLRVFGTIANIAIVILFLTDTVISALYSQRNVPDLVTSSITMLFTYVFMSLPVYLLMDTITDTTVICVMDEDEDNIISEEKPPPIMFNGSAA